MPLTRGSNWCILDVFLIFFFNFDPEKGDFSTPYFTKMWHKKKRNSRAQFLFNLFVVFGSFPIGYKTNIWTTDSLTCLDKWKIAKEWIFNQISHANISSPFSQESMLRQEKLNVTENLCCLIHKFARYFALTIYIVYMTQSRKLTPVSCKHFLPYNSETRMDHGIPWCFPISVGRLLQILRPVLTG